MLRTPDSPGSCRRKKVSASVALANALGYPSMAFSTVFVSGNRFGSTSIALPCTFQFVAQHERQLATLNGKPLVQRISPAIDQSPINALRMLPEPPAYRLPCPT